MTTFTLAAGAMCLGCGAELELDALEQLGVASMRPAGSDGGSKTGAALTAQRVTTRRPCGCGCVDWAVRVGIGIDDGEAQAPSAPVRS